MRHPTHPTPTEDDYEAEVRDLVVYVKFKPRNLEFRYWLLAKRADVSKHGPVSRYGNVPLDGYGDYSPTEVEMLAYRVALKAADVVGVSAA